MLICTGTACKNRTLVTMILFGIPQEEIVNRGIEASHLLPVSLMRELVERISDARTAADGASVSYGFLVARPLRGNQGDRRRPSCRGRERHRCG